MCRAGGVLCFGLWVVGCWGSGMVGGALLAAARCRWLALAGMGGGAAGGGRSAADRGSAAGARAVRSSRRPHRAGAGGAIFPPSSPGGRGWSASGCSVLGAGRRAGSRGKKKKARAGGAVCALLALVFLLLPAAGRGGCCSVLLAGSSGGRALLAAPRFRLALFQRQRFFRRVMRQNAAGQRGQILHLTAYRPTGNGELGSMPPYYPLLSPSSPLFSGAGYSRPSFSIWVLMASSIYFCTLFPLASAAARIAAP